MDGQPPLLTIETTLVIWFNHWNYHGLTIEATLVMLANHGEPWLTTRELNHHNPWPQPPSLDSAK